MRIVRNRQPEVSLTGDAWFLHGVFTGTKQLSAAIVRDWGGAVYNAASSKNTGGPVLFVKLKVA